MKCPRCGFEWARLHGENTLDEIYFSLPIRHGEGAKTAKALGIGRGTLRKGLKRLITEGLVSQPRHGYYVENLESVEIV
jgi:predicted ArsR family transcriptional regulator